MDKAYADTVRLFLTAAPVDGALRPKVAKDEGRNGNAENDTYEAIPDGIEIRIRREALEIHM